VAYRQLLTLACFTLGGALLGCGSDGNAPYDAPANADRLPTKSSDQAASNSDQPPPSSDRPPYNPDQPGGAPAPGGGGGDDEAAAEAACRALCDGVGTNEDDCPGGGANAVARSVCAGGCTVTAELRPCLAKGVALVNCLSGLDGLCTGDGPSESDAARCNAAVEELNDCTEPAGQPNPGGNGECSQSDGCASCTDNCDACKCALGDESTVCDSLCG
jgi:hypothetical protein